MSDPTGGGPLGSGYGRATNNGGTRAQSGPVPVGSPSNAAGIRGPREIMIERNAREARRRADQEAKEALEQSRAGTEQSLIDLENQRIADRRISAAEQLQRSDVRGGSTIVNKPSGYTTMPISQSKIRGSGRQETGGETMGSSNPRREAADDQSRQTRTQEMPKVTTSARSEQGPAVQPPLSEIPQSEAAPSSKRVTRSSFPHAFERWETLSAHWEGLTSYWVRRLEANSTDMNRDPLSQQMSRQITDLSAAGANLFHAVVELQRLRASSERKFQRWFYETRKQEERSQELHAIQEKALQEERANKADAIAEAVKVAVTAHEDQFQNQKVMKEMRRELAIAREEARRAWEELGRREQEERERTLSLRDGQPTLVGGVQVVPMMQGVTSRHSSARDRPPTRDGPPSERPISGVMSGQHPYGRGQQENTSDSYAQSSKPTTSSTRPGTSGTSYVQAMSSNAPAYQQHQGHAHSDDPTGREQHNRSYPLSEPITDSEYVIDAEGQYPRDAQGNKIKYRTGSTSESIDEYEARENTEQGQTHHRHPYGQSSSGAEYGQGSTATSSRMSAPPTDVYSGEGYDMDWTTAHHHPTRLSDVVEEDERSRTSASQLG